MQLQDIQFKKFKNKKRVGRGGKRGKTSGRGMNGQKSRSGANLRPAERDFIKKIPKLRGYKFNSFAKRPVTLSVSSLSDKFKDGDLITPEALIEKGLISKRGGKVPSVKILGNGDISIKLNVERCLVSSSAKEKIEAKGGVVK